MTTSKMRLNRFFLEVLGQNFWLQNTIYSLSPLKCLPEINTFTLEILALLTQLLCLFNAYCHFPYYLLKLVTGSILMILRGLFLLQTKT